MIHRENDPAFGITWALIFSITIWAILLCLVLAVDKVLGATTDNRFVFPDTTKQVVLSWHPDKSGAITRGYEVRIVTGPSVMVYATVDSSMIFNAYDLKDLSSAEILAWNFAGSSYYTVPVWAVFTKTVLPPIEPPPPPSDLPFSFSSFIFAPAGPWRVTAGIVQATDRPYDFGPGTYFWNGRAMRYLSCPKGTVKIVVDGCGYLAGDVLTVSVGTMARTIPLIKGTHWGATTYPHEAVFDMSVSGPFELAIEATNAMIKSVSGTVAGGDPAPPGVPLLPAWMKR